MGQNRKDIFWCVIIYSGVKIICMWNAVDEDTYNESVGLLQYEMYTLVSFYYSRSDAICTECLAIKEYVGNQVMFVGYCEYGHRNDQWSGAMDWQMYLCEVNNELKWKR